MSTENVHNLTGEPPETTDPNLQAEAAMSEAITELERLDGNGRVVAELLDAREAVRAEYRRQPSASEGTPRFDTGAGLPSSRGIADALSGELALYVNAGSGEYRYRFAAAAARDILRDAAAITDLVALVMDDEPGAGEVPDQTVARAAALARRLTTLSIDLQYKPE